MQINNILVVPLKFFIYFSFGGKISKLYRGESHREKVVSDLQDVCAQLGDSGAVERVAQKILEVADK